MRLFHQRTELIRPTANGTGSKTSDQHNCISTESSGRDMGNTMPDPEKTHTLLDVRGLICPLPVLKAKKAMKSLQPGDRIRLEATDPLASVDVPHFCSEDGHVLLEQSSDGPVQIFLIEKAGL